MTKPNRGKSTKLSIRLSADARQKIETAADNLGISMAGVILFELSKILKNPPSSSYIEEIEERITLERKHFAMSVNETIMNRINELAIDYDRKKNSLIGIIVSDHFERMEIIPRDGSKEPQKILVQVNDELKKKMIEYSEKHYIPLNILVGYSILQGPADHLPYYQETDTNKFFTNVPEYIMEIVKERAKEQNIREHFYTSLCIYKQFMIPGGRFFEE